MSALGGQKPRHAAPRRRHAMRMALVAHIVVLAVGGGAVTAAAKISAPPSLPRDAMAAPAPSEPAPTTSPRPTPAPEPSESPTPTAIDLEPADRPAVDETASLPDLDLAEFQNKLLP